MQGRENDKCQQYVLPFALSFVILAIYVRKQFSGNKYLLQRAPLSVFWKSSPALSSVCSLSFFIRLSFFLIHLPHSVVGAFGLQSNLAHFSLCPIFCDAWIIGVQQMLFSMNGGKNN